MGLFKGDRKRDDEAVKHLAEDVDLSPAELSDAPRKGYPDETTEHLAEDAGMSTEEFEDANDDDNSRLDFIPPPPG